MGGYSGIVPDDMEAQAPQSTQSPQQASPVKPDILTASPGGSSGPVKKGLRAALLGMLRNTMVGGLPMAAYPGDIMGEAQEKTRLNNASLRAQIDHANAQSGLAKAQSQSLSETVMVPLYPGGPEIPIAKKDVANILKQSMANQGKQAVATTQATGRMGAAGLKEGYRINSESGQPEAIPEEELSPVQKQRISQSQALEGLNNARAEYEQAKNDPESPVFKLARAKLLAAQQNAQASLGLRREALDARLTAQAGKVTTGVQNRAALADNIETNLQDMQEIANRRPDLFGPAAGRISQIKKAAGTSDPDILAWEQAKNNLAKSNMGMHGMRSKYGMEHDLENLSFINQPEGLAGTFSAIKNSADQFRNEPDALRAREAGKPGGSAKTGAGGLTIQRDAHGRIIGVK